MQPPQTASEGVTGHVQLPVGHVRESGCTFGVKKPVMMAAWTAGST